MQSRDPRTLYTMDFRGEDDGRTLTLEFAAANAGEALLLARAYLKEHHGDQAWEPLGGTKRAVEAPA